MAQDSRPIPSRAQPSPVADTEPPFFAFADRGVASVAERISSWFAKAFPASPAVLRIADGGVSVVRVGDADTSWWTAMDNQPVRWGGQIETVAGCTAIPLGPTPFVLLVSGVHTANDTADHAVALALAGGALQTAEGSTQVKVLQGELTSLHGVASKILALRDLDQVLLSLANEILTILEADMAGVLLIDDNNNITMRCCVGNLTTETARLSMAKGRGLAGRVAFTGQPQKVDLYLKNDTITHDFDSLARAEGTRRALAAPLIAHGEIIGVLEVWRRRRGPFTDADVERLGAMTKLAAIAIENARLFDQSQEALHRVALAERELKHQVEKLQQAAEIHNLMSRILLDGEGLMAIACAVGKELGADVTFLSNELALLASHPRDLNVADLHSDFVRLTRKAKDGIATTALQNRPGWLSVAPVKAGADSVGWLCIITPGPPSALTEIVLNGAVLVSAVWNMQARATEQSSSEALDKTLWDLLDGTDELCYAASARVLRMRVDLRKPHRVYIGRFHGLDEHITDQAWDAAQGDQFRRSLCSRVRRILEQNCRAELVGMRADVVAAIVPDTFPPQKVLGFLRGAIEGTAPLTLTWGVSSSRQDPATLRIAHSEARGALHVARRFGRGQTAVFDNLGLLRFLVGPSDDGDLHGFIDAVIGPLIVADRARNGGLLATLRGYLEANCSQAEAARLLFIHHKTMKYRLERIQQLSGLNLNLHDDRVRADLALRIYELGDRRADGSLVTSVVSGYRGFDDE